MKYKCEKSKRKKKNSIDKKKRWINADKKSKKSQK